MRILIAVLVLTGLTVVSSDFGFVKLPPIEYPYEPYIIPPRDNQSLENYAAVSYLVLQDVIMLSKEVYTYLVRIKFNAKFPTNATSEIDELVSNWQNAVENAYSFNFETIEQLESIVGHVNYSTDMYNVLIVHKNTYKYRRDEVWTNYRNLFYDESNETRTILEVVGDIQPVNDDLLLTNKNVAQLIQKNGIYPFYFHRKQLERSLGASLWNDQGIVNPQKVEEAVEKFIKKHGYYMPPYEIKIDQPFTIYSDL